MRSTFLLLSGFLAGTLIAAIFGFSDPPVPERFDYIRFAFQPDACPVSGTVRVIWFEPLDKFGGRNFQWGQFRAAEVCTFSVSAQTEVSKIPRAMILSHDSLPLGEGLDMFERVPPMPKAGSTQ